MAKLENGIFSHPKGKVANLIFSSNLGTSYIKINPGTRKRGNEVEVNTRKGFGVTTWAYMDPLKDYLRISYRELAKGNRVLNAARSYLLKYAVSYDEKNNLSIDPTEMLMGRGSLDAPQNAQVELTPDRELLFTWDPSYRIGSPKDQLMLLAHNVEAAEAATAIGISARHEGTAKLPLGHLPPGKAHIYLSFVSLDRSKGSDSVYLGELEV